MTSINKKQKTKNKKLSGFTLVELLVSLFVLTVAFSGLLPLASSSLQISRTASLRMQGEALAREGIEILRNLRDINQIKKLPFNQGFTEDGDYVVDSTDGFNWTLRRTGVVNSTPPQPLYLTVSKIVNHNSSGAAMPFGRILRIQNFSSPAHTSVISEVSIDEGKSKRKVSMQTLLFDWR